MSEHASRAAVRLSLLHNYRTNCQGDMDAFGHVNNVQYYRYIESARIAYLMASNMSDQDMASALWPTWLYLEP